MPHSYLWYALNYGWGYTHDRRADKYSYPHNCRADKDYRNVITICVG